MQTAYEQIYENPSMREWQHQNRKDMSREGALQLVTKAVETLLYAPRGHVLRVNTTTDIISIVRQPGARELVASDEMDNWLTVHQALDRIQSGIVTSVTLQNVVDGTSYDLYSSPPSHKQKRAFNYNDAVYSTGKRARNF